MYYKKANIIEHKTPNANAAGNANVNTHAENTAPPAEALMGAYYYLVERVVRKLSYKLPMHIDLEELHSVGVTGLAAAALQYTPQRKATFAAYANVRIRGAILDELRRLDTLPRTARQKAKKWQEAVQTLEQNLGREPKLEEIREALGQCPKTFLRTQRAVQPVLLFSMDSAAYTGGSDGDSNATMGDILPDEAARMPRFNIEQAETGAVVRAHINKLPQRQQSVLRHYYFEGESLRIIAGRFKVSEARICQIHMQALRNLRKVVRVAA